MAALIQLWNDWELQALVLLSFMLQVFIFFSGGLRQRSTNSALRILVWLAYLVADFIAVYALGQLSRQKNRCKRSRATSQVCSLLDAFPSHSS
uniref:DUF4220 domain-containing protein n=1 Tax=Oryza brachyantha TaxID=4533 RepID=J3LB47_ORYBR